MNYFRFETRFIGGVRKTMVTPCGQSGANVSAFRVFGANTIIGGGTPKDASASSYTREALVVYSPDYVEDVGASSITGDVHIRIDKKGDWEVYCLDVNYDEVILGHKGNYDSAQVMTIADIVPQSDRFINGDYVKRISISGSVVSWSTVDAWVTYTGMNYIAVSPVSSVTKNIVEITPGEYIDISTLTPSIEADIIASPSFEASVALIADAAVAAAVQEAVATAVADFAKQANDLYVRC